MIDLALLIPLSVQAAAEASSGGNYTPILVAALGAGSIGAVLAAAVTGFFTRRKLGAEATEIITKAASGVVESLNGEILRVNAAMAAVRIESSEAAARHKLERAADKAAHDIERAEDQHRHAREMDAVRRVLQLHVAWDLMARAKLSEHGIQLPEAPPLLPPLLDFPTE